MTPRKTFHQALQLVYFIQLILQIESNGHSVSLGRLDQYLFPFYEADLRRGILTAAEAEELLGCRSPTCRCAITGTSATT